MILLGVMQYDIDDTH